VNTLSNSLQQNIAELKKLLPSEDILLYEFQTQDQTDCAVLYADGIVNKQLIGDLIARPLSKLNLPQKSKKEENGHTMYEVKSALSAESQAEVLLKTTLFPELKTKWKIQDVVAEILDGNSLLLIDGEKTGFIVGAKLLPNRAIMEPPTDVTVKGPREGFIEDVKTNMSLVRKRLKSPDLQFETLRVAKHS
jgi:spore germination protein KA